MSKYAKASSTKCNVKKTSTGSNTILPSDRERNDAYDERSTQPIMTVQLIWKLCAAIGVAMGIVVSPIGFAFGVDTVLMCILIVSDIVWSLNIGVDAVLGLKTRHSKENTCSYHTTGVLLLLVNLLLCIPWDFLLVLPPIFRLLRVYYLNDCVKPFLFVQSELLKITCHQPVIRMAKIMMFIAMFSHVVACLYVVAGNSGGMGSSNSSTATNFSTTNFSSSSWIIQYINDANRDSGRVNSSYINSNEGTGAVGVLGTGFDGAIDNYDIYLRALHMSLQSLLTVGFGESSPKSIAGTLLMLCLAFTGAVVYALMIASLTSVIKNVAAVSNSRQVIKEMKSFLELQNVPVEFQRKTMRYLHQVGRRFGGMTEFDIYEKCLSPEMQANSVRKRSEVVYTFPLFQSFGKRFCLDLARVMQSETFLLGEHLVKHHAINPQIIFIVQGEAVGLSSQNKKIIQSYSTGSVIGVYNAIFRGTHAISEHDVFASSSTCDVLIVSQEQLKNVIICGQYIEVQQAISSVKSTEDIVLSKDQHTVMQMALIETIKDHKKNSLRIKRIQDGSGEKKEIALSMLPNDVPTSQSSTPSAPSTPNAPSHPSTHFDSIETMKHISLVVIMLWTMFAVPFRASQMHVQCSSMAINAIGTTTAVHFPYSLFIDYLCDIFTIVHFLTFDSKTQPKQHRKINTCIFLLVIFPYGFIGLFQMDWTMWALLRLSRLILVIKYFPDFLRSMLKLLNCIGIEHLSTREEVLMAISTVVVLSIHWLSCAWQSINHDASYVRAVYWSLVAISTTGFGELVPQTKAENMISITAMYLGATVFASLIACLASMQSARITPHNATYRTKVLSQLCTSMALSEKVTNNVLLYDQHRSNSVGNCDQTRLVEKIMPHHYKIEMESLLRLKVVQQSELFSKCSAQFQQMVVENLVCCFVAKNEIITKLDQACPGMFFLMAGKACMEFPRQDVNLVGNDCFGEQALFSGIENVKPTTVKATEHCELLVLEKRKFAAILEHLPELRYTLSELANDIHNNKTKQFMDKHKYIDVAQVKSRQEIDAEQSLAKKIRDKAFQCSRAVAPIILIIYIYLLPFQAAFLIHWEISYTSILFDIVAYLIISVDSISAALETYQSQRRTSNQATDGKNDNGNEACQMYIQYSWVLNSVALIPWEIATPFITSKTIGTLQAYALLHFPKFILLHQYKRYSLSIAPLLAKFHAMCSDQVYTLGGLLFLFSTCGHVLACSWFALSVQSTLSVDTTWATSYEGLGGGHRGLLKSCLPYNISDINNNMNMNNGIEMSLCFGEPVLTATMQTWYVSSMYYIFISLTTVGYGDIVAVNDREYLFTICVIILGTFILVFVLAKLEKIVANIDVASTLANRKAETLHKYVKLRKLPLALESRVNEYIEWSWKQRCGATMKETMSYLGTRQWEEIVMAKAGTILKSIPVFKEYPIRILHLVAQRFKPEVLLPHQVLFEAEEVSDPFYIMVEGEIDLLEPPSPTTSVQDQTPPKPGTANSTGKNKGKRRRRSSIKTQTVYMTLEGSCAVCMETFFIEEPRPCTARGSKGCQLFSLGHKEMVECLKTDPEAWANQRSKRAEIEEALRKLSLVKTMKKNLNSTKLMKMQSMTLAMDAVDANERKMFVPHSSFRQLWAFLMVFIVALDFLVFPARLAFVANHQVEFLFLVLGTIVDGLHVFNVYLHLYRFSIIDDDGVMINDVSVLIRRNIRSIPFYFRILAAVPIQLIVYSTLDASNAPISLAVSLALTRLPKLFTVAQAGGGELENAFERWGIKIDSGFFRTSKMGAAVLVVTHFIACFFLCIPSWQRHHAIDGTAVNMATPEARYLSAAYWAAYTISTVGYGDVSVQDIESMIFAMGVSLVGTVLCGSGLTALLTYWIDGVDQLSGLTHLKQKCVNLYLSHHSYTMHHRRSVQNYLDHMSTQEKSIHENEALNLLPSCLRSEILCHFTLTATKKFLKKRQWTSNGLLRSLCIAMKSYIASSMEELITLGHFSKRLYVLEHGNLQHIDGTAGGNGGETTVIIPPRTAFGGDFDVVSTCTVISVDISHLYYVEREVYQNILKFVSGARRSTENMMRAVTAHDLISNCRRGSTFTRSVQIHRLSMVSEQQKNHCEEQ